MSLLRKNNGPIYVGKSKLGEKGVFAKRIIKQGEKISTLKGEEVLAKDLYKLLQNSERTDQILVDPLQIDIGKYILLDEPYIYINHSCEPNAYIRNKSLVALKNIEEDEEITYDYSITWYEGFDCKCRSKTCRHHIADFSSIPEKTRKKYLRMEIVPDFIRKKLVKEV